MPAGAAARRTRVPLAVVYEDDDVVVVDKPAGLVVHPGAGHRDGTLVNGLLARYDLAGVGDPARPGHRAPPRPRDQRAARGRPHAGRVRRARRRARGPRRRAALRRGRASACPRPRSGTVDAPIGRSVRNPTRMAVRTAAARRARTTRWCARYDDTRAPARCRSRPGAPTRSACTSRRSATRCSVTRVVRPGRRPDRPAVPARGDARVRPPGLGRAMRFESPLPPDLADACSSDSATDDPQHRQIERSARSPIERESIRTASGASVPAVSVCTVAGDQTP